ncbi:MAG: phosphogluconate dehydratase, partial [Planktomarina sp.]
MPLNSTIRIVTDRIIERSKPYRDPYLGRMARAIEDGPKRAHLTCGNQAHAYAAMGDDQGTLANGKGANL